MKNRRGHSISAMAANREGRMNRTESRYADRLALLLRASEIADWKFQPEKLRLADRTFYEPDFRVVTKDRIVEFHDVKGTSKGKPRIEDDAAVKLKVAPELHPYRFCVVWLHGGTWLRRDY